MTTTRAASTATKGSIVLIPLGLVAGLALVVAVGIGWLHYRESAWPWTDLTPNHGWFHCVNETGMPVAWGWRYRGLNDGLNFVNAGWSEGGPGPDSWQAHAEVNSIIPGVPSVIEVHIQFPAASGVPEVTTSFELRSGLHVRLRVASDHRAFIAFGSATPIGYAKFDPEVQIGGS